MVLRSRSIKGYHDPAVQGRRGEDDNWETEEERQERDNAIFGQCPLLAKGPQVAQVKGVATSHRHNSQPFDPYRPDVWRVLREKYPSKMDPAKLEKETLKDGESPTQFLHKFQ